MVALVAALVGCGDDPALTLFGGGEVTWTVTNEADGTDRSELTFPGTAASQLSGGTGAASWATLTVDEGAGRAGLYAGADPIEGPFGPCGQTLAAFELHLSWATDGSAGGEGFVDLGFPPGDAEEVEVSVEVPAFDAPEGQGTSGSVAFPVGVACATGEAAYGTTFAWALDPEVTTEIESTGSGIDFTMH